MSQLEKFTKIEYEEDWNPTKSKMNTQNVVVIHQNNEENVIDERNKQVGIACDIVNAVTCAFIFSINANQRV